MRHLGNIAAGQTLNFLFSTNSQAGAAVAPTTAGTVTVYKDNGTTGTTNGVTYTPSFNALSGVNLVSIATSDAFYAAGHDYTVVLTGAVIDGQTVNAVLADFAMAFRAATADLSTIKGQAVTCLSSVTVAAYVGFAAAPPQDACGLLNVNLQKWVGSAPYGLQASGYVKVAVALVNNATVAVDPMVTQVTFPSHVADKALQPNYKPNVDASGNTLGRRFRRQLRWPARPTCCRSGTIPSASAPCRR